MKEIQIPIEVLFESITRFEKHEFENDKEYFQKSSLNIKDENNSWVPVKALIKKEGSSLQLEFSKNIVLGCSEKHLISINKKECIQSKDLNVGDEIILADDTKVVLENKRSLGISELFDFMVDSPTHLYQTPDGLIHHNTTMASYIAGQFQDQGELVGFVDAEHALDPEYAKTLGYDAALGIFSQPDSGEEALNILADLCLSGAVGLVIVDSVAALTPQKELDGEIGDSNIGLQARMMSQAMRKLRGAAKKSGTTVIFINQIRMKIGVMFGNPETTAGGMALKFYSSVRIEIRRKELLSVEEKADQEQSAFGQVSWYKTVKNKTAPPFRRANMKVIYGKGIQIEEEWIEACVKSGVIAKGGAGWMTLPSGQKVQGMDALIKILNEQPNLKADLISKVKAYELTTHANYVEEEEDNPTDDEVVNELLTDDDVADIDMEEEINNA